MELEIYRKVMADLQILPPRPWHSAGESVYAGKTLVCVAAGNRAEETARVIAQLPDALHLALLATPETLLAELRRLQNHVEELEALVAAHELTSGTLWVGKNKG